MTNSRRTFRTRTKAIPNPGPSDLPLRVRFFSDGDQILAFGRGGRFLWFGFACRGGHFDEVLFALANPRGQPVGSIPYRFARQVFGKFSKRRVVPRFLDRRTLRRFHNLFNLRDGYGQFHQDRTLDERDHLFEPQLFRNSFGYCYRVPNVLPNKLIDACLLLHLDLFGKLVV